MEKITWLWGWYKTIMGVITIIVIIFVIIRPFLYRFWWRFTRVKCPKCGGYKFGRMVGGPPRCIKCGWQVKDFSKIRSDKKKYYLIGWYKEK